MLPSPASLWHHKWIPMTFDQFNTMVSDHARPVILLEGTRQVPEADLPVLTAFTRWLAMRYPQAVFRSGNAAGSDTAFADGIKAVDPGRLELILPVTNHRRPLSAYPERTVALDQVSKAAEESAAWITSQASPIYGSMMEKRNRIPRVRAKANYLIRDTAKVTGIEESGYLPADVGIFYVNTTDPMKGGTGHTIRVCQSLAVPVIFQDEWLGWM